MRYVSTRGDAPSLNFVEVTLAGLARDGGLYVPETWPQLDAETIAGFAGKPYAEVAADVIGPFVGDTIAPGDLARMLREAYDTFRHPAVAPLTQLAPGTFVLELFHGPTLAFKDLAMQLIGRLMDHVLAKRRERTTVVVATSGDTGGAAVEAFRGRAQVDLVVLFPNGRISDVQRRMMTTAPEDNVHALAIEGTFDDCQAIVKGLFNHHAFRDRVRLSGVNSINVARIVAQVVYYVTAAVALGAPARKVAFTVPTGNFGDIFAGYVARRMGLPVDRQPHPERDIAGIDIAEITGRHRERDSAGRRAERDRRGEVVNGLRHDARPVDRIDPRQPHPVGKSVMVEHSLHDRLAVVEGAVDGDGVDVGGVRRGHHAPLHLRNTPSGEQHHEVDLVTAAERLDRGAAGVARGRHHDGAAFAARGERMIHQPRQELHGEVFEGERRAVKQLERESVDAELG